MRPKKASVSRLSVKPVITDDGRGLRGDRLVRIMDKFIERWLRLLPAHKMFRFQRDMERIKRILVAFGSTDPLTGLLNRRSGEQQLRDAIATARVPGIGLAELDINRFKLLNDTRGHQAGDKALKAVGQILHSSMRPTDLAIRWGTGDEIMLVFLGADSWSQFVAAINRIVLDLNDPNTQMARGYDEPEPLSFSIGCLWGEFPGNMDRRRSAPAIQRWMLSRVDSRMYDSKNRFKDHGESILAFERIGLGLDGEPFSGATKEVVQPQAES